ncbi:MAG: efflux RND transporter permease subunit, partial [Acidobacteriota bacterium]
MNISELFIRRPIATSLLMAAIALFGVISYLALPVADLPTVDYPTVNVGASLAGGDPALMASVVASPLERQFTTIAGIDEMTSSSSAGSSNITMTFDLDRNIDSAVVDVQSAIQAAMPLLPSTLTAPPSFRKANPADMPIMFFAVGSSSMSMAAVDDYAENILAPRISMVNGVSQVSVFGAQKYAVRVQVDPNKLKAQSVGLNEVDQALRSWNVDSPTGQLFGPMSTYTINANGLLHNPEGVLSSAAMFRPIVLSYNEGRPVRLEQVANVLDSVETTTAGAWMLDRSGLQQVIYMAVQKQPGTNVVAVTDAVHALLPALEAELPRAAHLSSRLERATSIRQSFKDVQVTMLVTLALVVGVIFLFLHNGWATL